MKRFTRAAPKLRNWKDADEWRLICGEIAALPRGEWFHYKGGEGTAHSMRQGISKRKTEIEALVPGLRVRMSVRDGKLFIKVTETLTSGSTYFEKGDDGPAEVEGQAVSGSGGDAEVRRAVSGQ
jgi:hypothetical protein